MKIVPCKKYAFYFTTEYFYLFRNLNFFEKTSLKNRIPISCNELAVNFKTICLTVHCDLIDVCILKRHEHTLAHWTPYWKKYLRGASSVCQFFSISFPLKWHRRNQLRSLVSKNNWKYYGFFLWINCENVAKCFYQ